MSKAQELIDIVEISPEELRARKNKQRPVSSMDRARKQKKFQKFQQGTQKERKMKKLGY